MKSINALTLLLLLCWDIRRVMSERRATDLNTNAVLCDSRSGQHKTFFLKLQLRHSLYFILHRILQSRSTFYQHCGTKTWTRSALSLISTKRLSIVRLRFVGCSSWILLIITFKIVFLIIHQTNFFCISFSRKYEFVNQFE